ncbi:MAG: hypothetical protein JW902_16895 [Syntrophaceae bacterium]|nr:hypothetical protein [Syntrophaceae bacterium]
MNNDDDNTNGKQIILTGANELESRSNSLTRRGLQELSIKPDLGLRLLAEGSSSHDDIFIDLRLHDLSRLSTGQYSTTVLMVYAGEPHALTIDFSEEQLNEILMKASPEAREQIKTRIALKTATVYSFALDEDIPFVVRACLGSIQKAALEQFVPLVVQEVIDQEKPGSRTELLVLNGSRKEVDAADITGALASLEKLLEPEAVRRFKGRLIFGIDGYDEDPRELFEIPKVRYWIQQIGLKFPYWFYFMNLGPASTLKLIAFSICKYEKVPGGKIIPPKELQKFLTLHFEFMNKLSAMLGESKEENDQRSREIIRFFSPRFRRVILNRFRWREL